ncbi:hypothetical protein mRhiFer1_008661 [Rhinolophus ferrumequinum]|uniref:Uncharacterized protein n=1 Tax=Rhinolophus ferrumequinum TaxID=59479 RepID=A0A7J7U166_RHIFE|nr:hypothetical protein mRhiFer1_008661 [Rhinolophus ferrumequinum]
MVNFNAVSSKVSASSVRSPGVGMAFQSGPKLGHISARLIVSFIEQSLDAGCKQEAGMAYISRSLERADCCGLEAGFIPRAGGIGPSPRGGEEAAYHSVTRKLCGDYFPDFVIILENEFNKV